MSLKSRSFNPSNVSITGGTIDGSSLDNGSGIPVILSRSGIPFIGLSTGSVAANGALSGITALPNAYPRAYCYFPANIVATVASAGWRYCTFSSTTAGTVFLDTYTSGTPTIPSSPTAVTDGKGAFTGDTSEEFGVTITVPANALGANGQFIVSLAQTNTNSAGTKFTRVRYSGQAGSQIFGGFTTTTVTYAQMQSIVVNRGATNAQVANNFGSMGPSTMYASGAPIYPAIDTTAATTIVFSGQRNTATDNLILEQYSIMLLSDGT